MANYRFGSTIPWYLMEGETALARLRHACAVILDSGFDYVEVSVGHLLELTEEELAQLDAAPLPFEACHCFVPGDLKIVGGSFEEGSPLYTYADKVMQRMRRLGIGLLVFGSGAARWIPDEVELADGLTDIGNFLWMCGRLAAQYGITVALEPLRAEECNAINLTCEAEAMAAMVGLPTVGYNADVYHMAMGGESAEALEHAAVLPRHVHVAEPAGRACPGSGDGVYLKAFAASLRRVGYTGRISVECDFAGDKRELAVAAAFLRAHF